MLIITIHNDRTSRDPEVMGNYDYEIRSTSNLGETQRIAKGRIEGFTREAGAVRLIEAMVEKELSK